MFSYQQYFSDIYLCIALYQIPYLATDSIHPCIPQVFLCKVKLSLSVIIPYTNVSTLTHTHTFRLYINEIRLYWKLNPNLNTLYTPESVVAIFKVNIYPVIKSHFSESLGYICSRNCKYFKLDFMYILYVQNI